jgi:two-component system chemotaxis response regulator CheB
MRRAAQRPAARGRAAAGHHRLVIVDDDCGIVDLLETRLSLIAGVTVAARAANGRDAIAIVRRLRPDLITLDLEMPVMGGEEAIPLLRRAAPLMRILLFTGSDNAKGLIDGCRPDAVVSKAAPLSELAGVVSRLLAMPGPRASRRVPSRPATITAVTGGQRPGGDRESQDPSLTAQA